MNEILPIIFAVVVVVLTIVLTAVGIQMIMILMEVKKTLKRVNSTLDDAEKNFRKVMGPLQSLGGAAAGLQTGFHVFEAFVGWLTRNKDNK